MNTKKFKTKDYANHIAESYRQDLLESIEQAKAGTLSPSGVEYCLEEIGMLRGTKEYPEDADELLREIRTLIDSIPQMTEREHEELEVAGFSGKLLVFYYLDRGTLLEIVEYPNGNGYYGMVFIREKKHKGQVQCVADAMKKELDRWVNGRGISLSDILPQPHPNETEIGRYATLEETLRFVYTALKYPDSVLT